MKNIDDYEQFIAKKYLRAQQTGFDCGKLTREGAKYQLFDWQQHVVRIALKAGKFALFESCGLGKTGQQIIWADEVMKHTKKPVLLLCPIAVASQTVEEGNKFGVKVTHIREVEELGKSGIFITNYDRMERFIPEVVRLGGIVMDESSLLKGYTGKIRIMLTEAFHATPYKLCCTATPAPNDYTELGQHAEFLNVMSSGQMLATWFINDTSDTGTWRLKKHARADFWRWVGSWAACISAPSDIGFKDDGYILPPLVLHNHTIAVDEIEGRGDGELFRNTVVSAANLHKESRYSLDMRCAKAVDLALSEETPCIIWCELNDESDNLYGMMKAPLPEGVECVEVSGSDSEISKERKLDMFTKGEARFIVSKAGIAGHGMNWQHCARQIFVGQSWSMERQYQAIRRSYRFGQDQPVHIHFITPSTLGDVRVRVRDKFDAHEAMKLEMKAAASQLTSKPDTVHIPDTAPELSGERWKIYNGDCVAVARQFIADESVGFSVWSPPFASLFVYSNRPEDMGNCNGVSDFMEHFKFLISELKRVTMPGRLCAVHCGDLLSSKWKDGVIQLQDFSGEISQAFRAEGWLFHSRITIWKSPVTEMQRTKAHGLLYKTLKKDSSNSRVGMPDYLMVFRKPGVNPKPIVHSESDFNLGDWQEVASPVWMTIEQGNVLNRKGSKETGDERHICLTAGSRVLTRQRGYIPIETISVGDLVLTHMGRWMPVTGRRCNGVNPTIRLCAQGVGDLRVTPDHELWTRIGNGKRAKECARNSDPSWIRADETIGSYLNLKLPPVENNPLTEDEWWIIGRWLGDGHHAGHKRSGKRGGVGQFVISCSHKEAPALIKRLGKYAGHAAKRTAAQIAVCGLRKEVREVLSRCGNGAPNKLLPGEAVTLSVEKSKALLDGYLSADGHYVEKYNRVCASSVSRALLLGLAMVAQRAMGVVTSVYAGRPERKGTIEGRSVNMRQDWIFSFRKEQGYRQHGWIQNDGAWKKVRKIEAAGDAEVWDISVAGDASFTAEGCIVKNCPLQLDVIERALKLWSAPGDLVYSPFTGIGSEGYQAVKMQRNFVGSELKASYFKDAALWLKQAESERELFPMALGDGSCASPRS